MTIEQAQGAMKKIFGFDLFRPMQADIIQTIFDKKDSLVLMPTGGGKSICYQLPAILMEGSCVVVSPLISLMKDQVEALRANGVQAAFLNSTVDRREQRQIEDDLFNGRIDLVYVSPEKLVSSDFIRLMRNSPINLIAIDEAHCISAWGHDFRPEYTQLKFLKKEFPGVPIVALTATADRATRRDIVEQLQLDDPAIFIASFDRPNLHLEVRPGQKRIEQIIDFIRQRPDQSGIIYCLSRKNTEDVAAKLKLRGIRADSYHAGMSDADRSRVQDAFQNDEIPVVCATVAFGMGIDKSNVRWVIHYNLPKNIESYYQEIGRSGRDGVKAEALLFYSFGDVMVLRDILGQNEDAQQEVKLAKLERMYQYATSPICRRKNLLSYFSEDVKADCGNCDVCENPPEYFDGTVLAQKALSAIARLKEQVAMSMLIDVLRGSGRKEVLSQGYHHIPTYGAGRDLSYEAWRQYLEQMLAQGLMEVAPDQFNQVKLNAASREVLFEGRTVRLVKVETIKKRMEEAKERSKPKTRRAEREEELFSRLRKLRTQLAQRKGVPPYIIFSDATLEEMSQQRPLTDADLMAVTGVGERKLHLYGNEFMQVIREFVLEKSQQGAKIAGATQIVTLDLYRQGKTADEIAAERGLSPFTIYQHLAALYEWGEQVDLSPYVSDAEVASIRSVLEPDYDPNVLKPIFDALEGQVPYHKIRLAMAILNRS